jgi:MFS transporter, YNFM family, putative membrane transport protein
MKVSLVANPIQTSAEVTGAETSRDSPNGDRVSSYPRPIAVFLCGVFAFIDLYSTQPLLPLLSRVFHASEARVGLTISGSTLGVAISAALLAVFAEQVDRKRTIVISMLMLAACSFLTATATSLPSLAGWRLLQGLVTPGIFIITIAYVTEEWPALLVPRVMSMYVAGTVFGGFTGRIAGGMLAERFGWRSPFVFLGVFGLGGALMVHQSLRPAKNRVAPQSNTSMLAPIIGNLRNPRLLASFGIGFCMLFTLVSVFSYVTFHLAAAPYSLTTEELSWLFTVYLLGLLATLAAGRVLARVGLRHGMLAAIGVSLTGVVITMLPSLLLVGIGLAMTGAGVFIAQTCANSFLRDAAPAGTRVSAAGMYICCYYIGGTVGGVLPGLAWRYAGWPGCVVLTCFFLLIGAALAFFGWRIRPLIPDPIPL